MSAAGFPLGSLCVAATEGVNGAWVAVAIIIVTLTVTAVALSI